MALLLVACLGGWAGCSPPVPETADRRGVEAQELVSQESLQLDVVGSRRTVHGLDRSLSLTGGQNASELRPAAASNRQIFGYRYRLEPGLAVGIDLHLAYADDQSGDLASGWELRLVGATETPLSLLEEPQFDRSSSHVSWGALDLPVTSGSLAGQRALLHRTPGGDFVAAFSAPVENRNAVRPMFLRTGQGDLRFEGTAGRLTALHLGPRSLEIERDAGGRIRVLSLHASASETASWRFTYRDDRLVEIAVRPATGEVVRLRYEYRPAMPSPTLLGDRWQRVASDPRWRTPERLTLATEPGLRFMQLDDDRRPDLVLADRRAPLRSWRREDGGWRETTDRYLPPEPLVEGLTPLAAQYVNFAKHYRDRRLNTDLFPALAVSRLERSEDPRRLAHGSRICFPPVRNGELQPASEAADWDCDDSCALRLPVPLQFEGAPWPTHLPAMASVERNTNQGARLVEFDLPLGRRPQIFYSGLRYRDAETGEVLLAEAGQSPLRDTGNCRFRYRTTFRRLGAERAVEVDLCQGFWRVRRGFWRERDEDPPNAGECSEQGKSAFWKRLDLDAEGEPTGRYIFPPFEDAAADFHLEHLRGVSFPRLRAGSSPFAAFALVMGRGKTSDDPALRRPAVRRLYGLAKGSWRWLPLPADDRHYPPPDFFAEFDGRFLDLDGDGDDDAVVATGARRRAWINRLAENDGRDWLESPGSILPRDCDLGSGSCQPLDLDGDSDLDLMVDDGRVVLLNRTRQGDAGFPMGMVSASDGAGRLLPVSRWP